MAAVSVRGLAVSFGSLKVLSGLDLDIAEGEFIVLLGPSGCGKSTLLNAIAGLIDISAGQVWIGGRNVTWAEPKDRNIGMVFQSYALYPRMTVEGNLSFGLKMSGIPKERKDADGNTITYRARASREEIAGRVARAAEILQIEPLLKRRPAELSGGQRQRVAMGRALVRDAKVFLFDEPLSNLDAILRAQLRVELKRLHQQLGGATMIYVTHDQIEALTLADRVAVMHAGVIQQLDVPRKIYLRPANRFVAGFVGSPAMNFRGGNLAMENGEPWFEAAGFRHPLSGYEFRGKPAAGQPVVLGIRPEHVTVSGNGAAVHQASADIIEPMGAEMLVWTTIAGEPFSIRLDGDAPIAIGQTMPVAFPGDRLNLFDAETGVRL
jgi:multiple sugar transport system ATP-binding protein